ncbi:hypothetical protein NPIL_324821 [Nephila pilipes]|uniref:Uncharacterized protein n=1 Tax=Nephila pilipes TaxID=299642 RepID=A0A8X6PDF3_NEPPI|nr:hypothetical protein NPIL_324821 [Nephila pilipes]
MRGKRVYNCALKRDIIALLHHNVLQVFAILSLVVIVESVSPGASLHPLLQAGANLLRPQVLIWKFDGGATSVLFYGQRTSAVCSKRF